LRKSGPGATAGPAMRRLQSLLITVEIAGALVLLSGGGLMIRSVLNLVRVDLGRDVQHVVRVQVALPASYREPAALAQFWEKLARRLAETNTVFSLGSSFPPFYENHQRPLESDASRGVQIRVGELAIGAGYFAVHGIDVRQGREFTLADRFGAENVAVVSESFAKRYWPGEDPIGRRLIRGKTAYTVVGVAADVEDEGAGQSSASIFYIPFSQNSAALTGATLVVRTAGRPDDFAAAVRAAVLAVDPHQPLEKMTTYESFFSDSLGPDRFRGTLLGVLAVLGLVLTAVGIYGVTACMVEERSREMGVRLVMGASPKQLWRLVAGGAVLTVAIGSVVGLAAAGLAAAAVGKLLPALTAAAQPAISDLWVAAPACLCLALTAFVAAGIPARRASKADAREVLR